MQSLEILRSFMVRHRWHYVAGVAILVVIDILQLIVPRVLGGIADAFAAGRLTASLATTAALQLVALGLFVSVGRWGWRQSLLGASRRLEADLRRRLFAHLQRMSSAYYGRHRVGDLMAHLTNDVQAVRLAAGQGVVLTVDAVFMTTAVIVAMAGTTDLRLTLLAALPLVVLTVLLARFGREVHRRFRTVQEGFSALTEFVEESIGGIRVVKSFARERQEQERFGRIATGQMDRQIHLVRIWGAMGPMTEVAMGLAFVVVILVGGRMVLRDVMSLGAFVAFTSYLGMLVWPLTSIGWLINMLQRGRASLDRLAVILNEPPDVPEAADARPVASLQGRIEVRHLSFTYPGAKRPALRDVSLTVEPGRTLGVVGRTGAGKTTLAMLLLRLYDPPAGTIFYDGVDVRSLSLAGLRRHIGYVPQESFLFSMSIEENIAFGMPAGEDASAERIEQAAKLGHVHDDIAGFPDGYRSRVGERGIALSGGQKQRAAIARALVRKPRILILDDSLSSVDTQTERAILTDLRSVLEGRTAVVIAHRLSAVRQADEIVVLDDGAVVERGTHDELLERGGLYARIYRRQMLEAELQSR